jgi:hypothetical protein
MPLVFPQPGFVVGVWFDEQPGVEGRRPQRRLE